MSLRRRTGIRWGILVGMTLCAAAAGQPAWAAGRTPPPPPKPASQSASTDWYSRFHDAKYVFKQRDFHQAVGLFETLARQHPDDPWLELYLRVTRIRIERAAAALTTAPAARVPAMLRVMGMPPVHIRPVPRSEIPVEAPAEPSAAETAAGAAGTGEPGSPEAVPSAAAPDEPAISDAPAYMHELAPQGPPMPYPAEIPLPPPGPISTAPAADVPVQAHADVIEFSPELQRVIGRNHVRIEHEGMTLTCDRIIIFSETRDALAEGHVRLLASDGLLTGDTVYYNFATKKGTIIHGGAEFFPWYSRGPHMVKTSEHTVLVRNGYVTTCDLDPPHYRMQSKKATVYLNDKIVSRNVTFYIGRVPLFYMPRWTYSLRENRNKFSIFPGKKKPWGAFLLTKYRYELNENAKGNLHWDWRENFGHAQGLDYKYVTKEFGYGLVRGYYNEEPYRRKLEEELLKGQHHGRYRLLWRHRWDLDPTTNLVLDYQKYSDVDFRRDFLFREEFQFESSPESFVLLTRAQPNYTFTTLAKKRFNRYDSTTEILPEIKMDLREQRVRNTRLYYDGDVTVGNYNSKTARSDLSTDVQRADVFNQLRYAMKIFRFYNLTPRTSVRHTYYTKDKQGGAERPDGERDFIRGVWSTGFDLSTKFYRMFDVQTDLWGLNIRQMRHVITPTFSYTYTPMPTVVPENLASIDGTDSINRQNTVTIGLENKIQAKQMINGALQKVDMIRVLLSAPYNFNKVQSSTGKDQRLGDVTFDVEMQPVPWVRFETDVTYGPTVDDFKTWNMDLVFSSEQEVKATRKILASEVRDRSLEGLVEAKRPRWRAGVGHRYEREARAEMTAQLQFQPHPKWWIDLLTRYTYKEVAQSEKRINSVREFQVILTRDLHDWLMQVTIGEDSDLGGIFLVSFVLKAFPENTVALEDSYHHPKQGSQSSAFYAGSGYYAPPTTP